MLLFHISFFLSCRNNSTDELENAEFIGVNSYLHCNGTQSPDDPFPGFESLVSDFADYQMTVPVMVCVRRWNR